MNSVAEYYKQLVPNTEVTLPGSTCDTCTPQSLSPANTWTPQSLALLVERLGGAIVATHSQSGIMGHHMVRILKERGRLDLVKGLITIEGGCSCRHPDPAGIIDEAALSVRTETPAVSLSAPAASTPRTSAAR